MMSWLYDQASPTTSNLLKAGYTLAEVNKIRCSEGRTCTGCNQPIHWSRYNETLCPNCLSEEYAQQCSA